MNENAKKLRDHIMAKTPDMDTQVDLNSQVIQPSDTNNVASKIVEKTIQYHQQYYSDYLKNYALLDYNKDVIFAAGRIKTTGSSGIISDAEKTDMEYKKFLDKIAKEFQTIMNDPTLTSAFRDVLYYSVQLNEDLATALNNHFGTQNFEADSRVSLWNLLNYVFEKQFGGHRIFVDIMHTFSNGFVDSKVVYEVGKEKKSN